MDDLHAACLTHLPENCHPGSEARALSPFVLCTTEGQNIARLH